MGYQTYHTLTIVSGDPFLIEDLREENDEARHAIDLNGDPNESCKWYDHEQDLLEFSEKHPDTLFLLEGEGEEAGDIWKTYFKNGKMQTTRAKLVFEEYDESKLK